MAATMQHWKETSIKRAEGITDALEVALAYSARVSEWIILLCILLSVSQALPGVQFPLWASNVILWLQIITLDIAGLSLMALEKNARANGNTKAANTARGMMIVMISITMITLLAVNVEHLVPSLASLAKDVDFALVFVRISVSLIFKFVIVNIRSSDVQVIPLRRHEEKITELLAGFTRQVHEHLAEQLEGVRTEVRGVQSLVQVNGSEPVQQLVPMVRALVQERDEHVQEVVQSLVQQVVHPLVQRIEDYCSQSLASQSTTVEQVQIVVQQMVQSLVEKREELVHSSVHKGSGTERSSSLRGGPLVRRPEPTGVQIVESVSPDEPLPESVQSRVQRFIQEQLEQGKTPSLKDIMEACACSKNTAIRYRRDLLGATDEGSAA